MGCGVRDPRLRRNTYSDITAYGDADQIEEERRVFHRMHAGQRASLRVASSALQCGKAGEATRTYIRS